MISDVHVNYLLASLRVSEAQTKGWEGLLDHATPRVPEPILAELRDQLADSREETEGWRKLHDWASANLALPAELARAEEARHAAELASYSTGARLDAPPKPCTCGLPGTPGMTHRQGGHPCYTIPAEPARAEEPQQAGGQAAPEPPAGGQDPADTAAWTPEQEEHFRAFEGIHAGREAVAPGEYGPEGPARTGGLAGWLKPKNGGERS